MSAAQVLLIGCGAAVGLGLFLLLRTALVIEQPRLSDALARLDGRAPPLGRSSPCDGACSAAGAGAGARSPPWPSSAPRSIFVVPWGMSSDRWIARASLVWSSSTSVTTTPRAPARPVRPERWT